MAPLEAQAAPEAAAGASHGTAAEPDSSNLAAEAQEPEVVKTCRAVFEPTAEEIARHEVTHEPYRAWCPACVAGRGVDDKHTSSDHTEDALPTIGLDYGYLGEREDASPILCGKDSKHRWFFGEVMPFKGTQHPWCAKHVAHLIGLAGHKRLIMRTDGEPAIASLRQAVAAILASQHGVEVVPERPVVGDSKSNGLSEHAVREVKAKVRTLRHALEKKLGVRIDMSNAVLPWMVRHAAALINRGRPGVDGRTAYELRYGKPFRMQIPMLGERVLWLSAGKRASRLEDRYKPGIFLGLEDGTNEYLVGIDTGVSAARALRRQRAETQWDTTLFEALCGTPWRRKPQEEDPEASVGPLPRVVIEAPAVVPEEQLPKEPGTRAPERQGRQVYIRRNVELEKYGKTDGCPGCVAAELGTRTAVTHTAECRARIQRAMDADPDMQGRM